MINSGRLRYRITIQRLTDDPVQPDDMGDPVTEYTDVATVWANYRDLSGREFFAAQQVNSEIAGEFEIRYRDGLDTSMRILFNDKKYDIESITDPEGRRRRLYIKVKEGVVDG